MPKVLAISGSDNHLEYCAYAGMPQMWGDSYFAFQQLFDEAERLAAPAVLLGGDVFDKTQPDSYTLKRTFEQVDRAARLGIRVLYTQGQHELNRRQPWLSLHPHPEHLHERTVEILGRALYGLDWQPADLLADALGRVPAGTDLLLCHQVWEEFMGSQCAPEGSIARQVPHARLVITGDFHGHRQLTAAGGHGSITILSPGSATWQNVAEDPNKYAYVVYDDLTFASFPLRNRRVYYSSASDEKQLLDEIDRVRSAQDDVVRRGLDADLPGNLQTPVWVFRYRDDIPDGGRRLARAARGQFHFFPRPVGLDTAEDRAAELVAEEAHVASEPALASMLAAGDITQKQYELCLTLLSVPDPVAELDRMVRSVREPQAAGGQMNHA